jgi:hypothetical protein
MKQSETNLGEKGGKRENIFHCICCDYKCSVKFSFDRHVLTSKHLIQAKMKQNETNQQEKEKKEKKEKTITNNICECGLVFYSRTTMWRHKQKCGFKNIFEMEEKEKVSENKDELIQYLINENKEFKNLILEIVKKDTTINNNNNNMINSNNKTFNLNFFLNETCKDAMNMSDFINSLTLQLSDLESVGKLGFVDGISNIIIKNLEALDIEKRPVHCCDAKRETMYIKDQDKWEKDDNEMKRMKELVRYVRDKNISMVNIWRDLYPECVKSNSKKTTQFNQIYMESFGGEKGTKKEKEEKIISRIAKAVVIDKHE